MPQRDNVGIYMLWIMMIHDQSSKVQAQSTKKYWIDWAYTMADAE